MTRKQKVQINGKGDRPVPKFPENATEGRQTKHKKGDHSAELKNKVKKKKKFSKHKQRSVFKSSVKGLKDNSHVKVNYGAKKQNKKHNSHDKSKPSSAQKHKGRQKKTSISKESRETPCTEIQPGEYSSNWKLLMKEITKEDKKKPRKSKPSEKSAGARRHKTKHKEVQPEQQASPDIWFDDVDEVLLDASRSKQPTIAPMDSAPSTSKENNPLVKPKSFTGITNIVAMDCEMVGVGAGGVDSILARVSLVNHYGQCIYDKFVKPREDVTDYRTHVSGVRPADIANGEEFTQVQKDVYDIVKGKILVGHALTNDLKVLFLDHPRKKIRDTSKYKPFKALFKGRTPGLKKLSATLLGVSVQTGEHSSVQDAQAAMRLYTMYRKQWEKDIKLQRHKKPNKQTEEDNSE